MAGRHARPADPSAPPPTDPVDRRLALAAALVLLAVLIIAAVLKLHLLGGGSTSATGPANPPTISGTKAGSSGTTPGATGGASPTGGSKSVQPPSTVKPTPKPSATPTATPKPTPKPTSTPKPTPTPKPTTTTPPPPPPPHYPLLVLNNSAISGLGTAAAADFEHGGWTIAGVGNLTGRIKDTTIYYSPGYRASALALARQFPQLHRVLPRINGLPGHAELTVVVTRYYDVGK